MRRRAGLGRRRSKGADRAAGRDRSVPVPGLAGPAPDDRNAGAPWDSDTPPEYEALSDDSSPPPDQTTDSPAVDALVPDVDADEELDETLISSSRDAHAPEPTAGKPACIVVISHPNPAMLGRQYPLGPGDEIIIGRSASAAISLPDIGVVSRRHARLFRSGEAVMIEDLGSRNGTFLQGERLRRPARLRHGDQFSIDAVHFRFLGGGHIEQAFHEAIYDLVTHDDLTGIYNRRKYEKEVERDFARAVRHSRQLALVLMDIDGFKIVNDHYGHLCGDAVLQQLAELVSKQLRREGIFARLGGDEFIVLCPEVGLEGARVLAERLRTTIAFHPFRFRDLTLRVTCSFGVAELTPSIQDPDALYAAADARLYVAKSEGRNRIA